MPRAYSRTPARPIENGPGMMNPEPMPVREIAAVPIRVKRMGQKTVLNEREVELLLENKRIAVDVQRTDIVFDFVQHFPL